MTMLALYPGLRDFPASEWQASLQRARDVQLDILEWIGVIAGVAVATWVLRGLAPGDGVVAATALNVMRFFLAIPLLMLVAGPFLLRRTRRGLEIVRHQREFDSGPAHFSQGGRS